LTFAFLSSPDIALELAQRVRARRLDQNLTLEGLASRAAVPLGTLKKFERSGQIGLVSFIRLVVTLRGEAELEQLLPGQQFERLAEVLEQPKKARRGRIK
jgi:transcriptional regulator with XRE-family HTH domain